MSSFLWDDFISKIIVKIWSLYLVEMFAESNMAVVCRSLRHCTQAKAKAITEK